MASRQASASSEAEPFGRLPCPAARTPTGLAVDHAPVGWIPHLSVLETILFVGVTPVVLYGVIATVIALPKLRRQPKRRPGDPWNYKPLWWTANLVGAHLSGAVEYPRTGDRGGASGSW